MHRLKRNFLYCFDQKKFEITHITLLIIIAHSISVIMYFVMANNFGVNELCSLKKHIICIEKVLWLLKHMIWFPIFLGKKSSMVFYFPISFLNMALMLKKKEESILDFSLLTPDVSQ